MSGELDPLGFIDEDGDALVISLPPRVSSETGPITGLRWWQKQDVDWRVNAIAENRAWLAPHFSWAYGHCRDAERQWMAGLSAQRASGAYHYAVIVNREPVGSVSMYIDAHDVDRGMFTPSTEITYWIAREHAGKGYGKAALAAATRTAHDAGIATCYLLIDRDNAPSLKTAMANNYVVDRPAARPGEQVLVCHVQPVVRGADFQRG